jgi:ABC-type dipeptide/oligopeptide/nickel transport system ATPase component
MADLVTIRDLHIAYRDSRGDSVPAVKGVDLTLRAGVRYGLVGESGSGKSTVVRSLVGLIRPPAELTASHYSLAGQDILTASPAELRAMRGKTVAYIPQNPFGALHPVLTVGDQLHRYLKAHGATKGWAESAEKSALALRSLGIVDPLRVLEGPAGALSGGMAQRVVIAMSKMLHPQLVVADEPTTALDVTVQKQVLELIASPRLEDRHALLLTTHDLGVVAQYCDEVFVMYHGEIVERGLVSTVFTRPAHEYTAHLLSAAPKSRFNAQEAVA